MDFTPYGRGTPPPCGKLETPIGFTRWTFEHIVESSMRMGTVKLQYNGDLEEMEACDDYKSLVCPPKRKRTRGSKGSSHQVFSNPILVKRIVGYVTDIRDLVAMETTSQRFYRMTRRYGWDKFRSLSIGIQDMSVYLDGNRVKFRKGHEHKFNQLVEAIFDRTLSLTSLKMRPSGSTTVVQRSDRYLVPDPNRLQIEALTTVLARSGDRLSKLKSLHMYSCHPELAATALCRTEILEDLAVSFDERWSAPQQRNLLTRVGQCSELRCLSLAQFRGRNFLTDGFLQNMLRSLRQLHRLELHGVQEVISHAQLRDAVCSANTIETLVCGESFHLKSLIDVPGAPLTSVRTLVWAPHMGMVNFRENLSALVDKFPNLRCLKHRTPSLLFVRLMCAFLKKHRGGAKPETFELVAYCGRYHEKEKFERSALKLTHELLRFVQLDEKSVDLQRRLLHLRAANATVEFRSGQVDDFWF